MALGKNRRNFEENDTELDLVPIMNMFLVLIPFLLLSASFYQIKAINTSVPVLTSSNQEVQKSNVKSQIKITVILELKERSINITAMSDELEYSDLVKLEVKLSVNDENVYPLKRLSEYLISIKNQYPKSDTLILIPSADIVYGTIIQAMDTARSANNEKLFPNVVLSGKIG